MAVSQNNANVWHPGCQLRGWPFRPAQVLVVAVRSKNAHYRLQDIQRRHWNVVAKHNAMGNAFAAAIEGILARTPGVVNSVGRQLPTDFPMQVAEPVFEELLRQAKRLDGPAQAGD